MNESERFFAKVDRSGGQDSCHPWTASTDRAGYGWFWFDGRPRKATRWVMGHVLGRRLQVHEWVLHHCDNPTCCNPRHLYIGDAADNAHDRDSRGRAGTNGYDLRTHCEHGHPFDTVNTYVDPRGFRQCRECRRQARRRYQMRRAA